MVGAEAREGRRCSPKWERLFGGRRGCEEAVCAAQLQRWEGRRLSAAAPTCGWGYWWVGDTVELTCGCSNIVSECPLLTARC